MSAPGSPPRRGQFRATVSATIALWLAAASPAPVAADAPDPLLPLVGNLNRYFHDHELQGVVVDDRWVLHEPEAVRLSVTSQLLGYNELHHACPRATFRADILDRSRYLIDRIDRITGGSPFDGMLGFALLGAHAETGDSSSLAAGQRIVDELSAIPEYQLILNGGLMAAMAFALHHRITGDTESERKARVVLGTLPSFQNPDGSFPHWCGGTRDIHYTGWMAMELILIRRVMPSAVIDSVLPKMLAFLDGRVDDTGVSMYEGPCDNGDPDCREYYDSVRSGCDVDYDTRAFTNELGYSAMLFDHYDAPKYAAVMRFLAALEYGGAIADKWDFWPPPEDPYFPWTAADTSVVNMSVLFWSLAAIVNGRGYTARELAWTLDHEDPARRYVPDEDPRTGPTATWARSSPPPWCAADSVFLAGVAPPSPPAATGAPPPPRPRPALALSAVSPNPSRGVCDVRFTISRTAPVSVTIHDAAGRRVRSLDLGSNAAGAHTARWDQRDDRGARVPAGIYFLRVRAAAETATARVLAIR